MVWADGDSQCSRGEGAQLDGDRICAVAECLRSGAGAGKHGSLAEFLTAHGIFRSDARRRRPNLTITVQAGIPLRALYDEVQKMSLYFPPHPGDEGAFVGGAVAANAGGARAVKYGTVRRFVLGLQVVMASGEILELGGKYIKSSTGYHLVDLMIGSEGTLGVITRSPSPAAARWARCRR